MTIAIHRPWVHWRVVLWCDLSWYWCICLVPDKGAPVKHCWVVHCSMIWINCDTICMIPISCWRPKCIICEHLWGSSVTNWSATGFFWRIRCNHVCLGFVYVDLQWLGLLIAAFIIIFLSQPIVLNSLVPLVYMT